MPPSRTCSTVAVKAPSPKERAVPSFVFRARLCQALPKAVAFILQQQNLDCAAGGLPVPQQPGWQDAGIVDDQAVARGEIITKVCKVPVLQRTSPAVQV